MAKCPSKASPRRASLTVEGVYDEGVTLDESKNLILQGGWDSNFTSQSSQTTVASLTVSGGTVEVDKIVLQ